MSVDLHECPGCTRTFAQLDALLRAATDYEVECTGADAQTAKLHAIAAIQSWWLDRSLTMFGDRARAFKAVQICLANVFHEQGVDRFEFEFDEE